MQVSIIQLFDMTIPFGTNVRDTEYSMVVAHERNSRRGSREIARQRIAMMRTRRDGALKYPALKSRRKSRRGAPRPTRVQNGAMGMRG